MYMYTFIFLLYSQYEYRKIIHYRFSSKYMKRAKRTRRQTIELQQIQVAQNKSVWKRVITSIMKLCKLEDM